MRLEIVDEARDFAESFGPHNISSVKVQYQTTVDQETGKRVVGKKRDLVMVHDGYTVVVEDIQAWAEYLTDLL